MSSDCGRPRLLLSIIMQGEILNLTNTAGDPQEQCERS